MLLHSSGGQNSRVVCEFILCVHLASSVRRQCKMYLFILSFLAFGISISSNWYAYEYYYEGSPLSQNLTAWWYSLSLWGTIVNFIFLILDCCCCCYDGEDEDKQGAMATISFFATVLLGDLPLLFLSLGSINEISYDHLCEGSDDVLFFFQLRRVISVIVPLFYLIRVCVLNCNECFKCLFCFYILYFTLSVIVFAYAIGVC